MASIRTENTMHVLLDINKHQLVALLHVGSIYNFAQDIFTARLGLSISTTIVINVMVAKNDTVGCHIVTWVVPLLVGAKAFTTECYATPLDGYDVVMSVAFSMHLGVSYMVPR